MNDIKVAKQVLAHYADRDGISEQDAYDLRADVDLDHDQVKVLRLALADGIIDTHETPKINGLFSKDFTLALGGKDGSKPLQTRALKLLSRAEGPNGLSEGERFFCLKDLATTLREIKSNKTLELDPFFEELVPRLEKLYLQEDVPLKNKALEVLGEIYRPKFPTYATWATQMLEEGIYQLLEMQFPSHQGPTTGQDRPEAEEKITTPLGDAIADPFNRNRASLKSLGDLGAKYTQSAIRIFRSALNDDAWEVRKTAAEATPFLPLPMIESLSTDLLYVASEDLDRQVQGRAIEALLVFDKYNDPQVRELAAGYILEDQYKSDINYDRSLVIEFIANPGNPTNGSSYNRWLAEMDYGYTSEEFEQLTIMALHENPFIADAAIDRMYYAVYFGYPGANLDTLIGVVESVLLDTNPLNQQVGARAVKMYEDYLGELSPLVKSLGISLTSSWTGQDISGIEHLLKLNSHLNYSQVFSSPSPGTGTSNLYKE